MKHNIIFAVLTAAILIFGFFAVDIVQIFNNSSNDENFRSIPKTEDKAVYLSDEREIINPMASLKKSDKKIPYAQRSIAAAVVSAMSRYSMITYIAWGIDVKLDEAWQDGGDSLIYIDKWKYRNYGRKSERLLDCIINTDDFSIVYIRFYSEEVHDLPSYDLNNGLEKIRNQSDNFYPNINVIHLTMSDVLNELKTKSSEWEYDNENIEYHFEHEFYDYIDVEYNSYTGIVSNDCIEKYTDMQKFVDYIYPNSELHKFWLSPLDMYSLKIETSAHEWSEDYSYEKNKTVTVNPVNYVIDEFYEIPQWFTPSYSTKDGRIYQTITLNDGCRVTVIYSVKEDIVEGFYFETN